MALIKVTELLDQPATAQASLSLPFELRQKSRLKAKLDSGEEIGLMLPRGRVSRVVLDSEPLSVARADKRKPGT